MMAHAHDVLGIGNAIVDVLARVDEGFITRHGVPKGSLSPLCRYGTCH